MTYGEFLMSLPSPTSFNVFSMKPLEGSGVLEINPSIVFPIIDRLLGGHGEGYDANRDFTDIELNLLDTMLKLIMQNLKDAWSGVTDMYPVVEVKESSPNVVQIVAQNEIVIMVVLELIVGHTSGMMNICYPVIGLEPLLPKLASKDIMLSETSSRKSRNRELRALLGGANVEMEAILGTTHLDLKTVLDVGIGDVIRLDQPANDTSIIAVNGKQKFLADLCDDAVMGYKYFAFDGKVTLTVTYRGQGSVSVCDETKTLGELTLAPSVEWCKASVEITEKGTHALYLKTKGDTMCDILDFSFSR
jgi:flagellar motor switch protein FliM